MSDDVFKKIQSSDAGFQFVEHLEQRDRQRWERNALKQTRVVDAKLTSKVSSVAIAR